MATEKNDSVIPPWKIQKAYDECVQDEQLAQYFKGAPNEAAKYIALEFYFKVYSNDASDDFRNEVLQRIEKRFTYDDAWHMTKHDSEAKEHWQSLMDTLPQTHDAPIDIEDEFYWIVDGIEGASFMRQRSLAQIDANQQSRALPILRPAWRLTRTGWRRKTRTDWEQRWEAAGDSVDWLGASQKEFVALKNSPIWEALGNGIGGFEDDAMRNPYPPFAAGSGMGWVHASRKEVADLGIDVNSCRTKSNNVIPPARIQEAFDLCMKDQALADWYTNAPEGAQRYIASEFYFLTFPREVSDEVRVNYQQAIENTLSPDDVHYLAQYSVDESFKSYFKAIYIAMVRRP